MASALLITSGTWKACAYDMLREGIIAAIECGVASVYSDIGINPGKRYFGWRMLSC